MKKTLKALQSLFIFAFILTSFIACDKDFSSIDSDVLGKDNANFNTNKLSIEALRAYNKKLKNVQVNGLNSNLLGYYNDPIYGKTTASIVSQIVPTSFSPDFGNNPAIDSVILSIPYFSRQDGVDDDGNAKYVMTKQDSLYGDKPINLYIYKNNYFLRDFNPNAQNQETQNYFSFSENTPNNTENFIVTESGDVNFDTQKGELIYSSDVDNGFSYSSEPVVTLTGEGEDATLSYAAPALRVDLYNSENTFWEDHIFAKQDGSELSNANNFKNYFRGLYIKAEPRESNGSMTLLNLAASSATITIYYTKDPTTDGDPRVQATYAFNFNGIRLNTITNDYSTAPPLVDGNSTEGDQTLYLKGGAGSMAVIDLFGNQDLDNNGFPDALDDLKSQFRDGEDPTKLINEAHLVIIEDQSLASGDDHTYDRLYAYDVNNNIPLIDYSFDPSENTVSPLSSKIIHLGVRDTLSESPLTMGYKIRITEHMKNLVFKDSTNTKLGLVISNNVNYTGSVKLLNSTTDVTNVPASTVLTSRGTMLYGNNTTDDKKIKLEIYFSEPE